MKFNTIISFCLFILTILKVFLFLFDYIYQNTKKLLNLLVIYEDIFIFVKYRLFFYFVYFKTKKDLRI